MGEIDKKTKEYLSHKDIFADVFNYALYDGSQVIKPDDLSELDPVEIAALGNPGGEVPDPLAGSDPAAYKTKEADRDIVRLWCSKRDDSTTYLIFGIESQKNIHYAMPVRCALYDAMNYVGQVKKADRSNRQLRKAKEITVTGDEYISGFRKKDRLTPIITLTIYLGADKWDGPRSLFDMIGPVSDDRLLPYINNYRLNMIVPAEIPAGGFEKFNTDLGVILEFIKYSKDKKMFRELASTDRANTMDPESVRLANLLTGSKLKISDKGGNKTMCKAIDDMIADSRAEGMAEGIAQGKAEGIAQGKAEGIAQGKAEGIAKGKAEGIIQGKAEGKAEGRESALRDNIGSMVEALHITVMQAMDILKIPENERYKFL